MYYQFHCTTKIFETVLKGPRMTAMFKEDNLFFYNSNCTKSTNETQEIEFISDCNDRRDKMFNDIILYSYIIQKVATFLIGIDEVSK